MCVTTLWLFLVVCRFTVGTCCSIWIFEVVDCSLCIVRGVEIIEGSCGGIFSSVGTGNTCGASN